MSNQAVGTVVGSGEAYSHHLHLTKKKTPRHVFALPHFRPKLRRPYLGTTSIPAEFRALTNMGNSSGRRPIRMEIDHEESKITMEARRTHGEGN